MGGGLLLLMALSLLSAGASAVEGSDARADPDRPKPRARELGLEIGVLSPGPFNAISRPVHSMPLPMSRVCG
jgi:hypothetical protein